MLFVNRWGYTLVVENYSHLEDENYSHLEDENNSQQEGVPPKKFTREYIAHNIVARDFSSQLIYRFPYILDFVIDKKKQVDFRFPLWQLEFKEIYKYKI